MKTITATELAKKIASHNRWIIDGRGEKLRLVSYDLRRSDLSGSDLRRSDLSGSDLSGSDLSGSDLSGSDLSVSDLSGSDLSGSDLRRSNLSGSDLHNSVLHDTVLDPNNTTNGLWPVKPTRAGYVVGYRTRAAGHIDMYRDGRYYSADVFSTCEETECHPGLYIWPTLELARDWSLHSELIKIRTKLSEVHQAGSKWRCRWFEVIGSV